MKILYFVDRMGTGGIQTLIMNLMRNFDLQKMQVDFLLLDDGGTHTHEEMLKKMGCNIYKLDGIWLDSMMKFPKYKCELKAFLKKHNDYDVIHLHSSSKNYLVLKYAKKYGIKVRIAHSHNTSFQTKNVFKNWIGDIFKKKLKKYATHYFACSKSAGEWLFGDADFTVIRNAIDVDSFRRNDEVRGQIREELGIESKKVFGHIGRFTNQKNHTFLIDIFNEIRKVENACLLLLGGGELDEEMRGKVRLLGLESKVFFLGVKQNVKDYLWAMDAFILPSKHEGLPLTLIEAQAAGLPTFISKEAMSDEVMITPLITCKNLCSVKMNIPLTTRFPLSYVAPQSRASAHSIVPPCLAKTSFVNRISPLLNTGSKSLNEKAESWAEFILSSNLKYHDYGDMIKKAGYDIKDTATWLEDFYFATDE